MEETYSLKKQITVGASIDKAFEVFTERFDSWWPKGYKIGQSPMKKAVLESKPSGRWYEVGEDGSTTEWGKVLAWEPPSRILFAWQISSSWCYDPDFMTELEITFKPDGLNSTIVTLEHRNLDRYGAAYEMMRKTFEGGGWGLLMNLYAAAVKGDLAERQRLLEAFGQAE